MTREQTTDLEHELSAALKKVDEQCELLRLCKEENEEQRKDIVWTMGERAKLIDRIKRMEEAGNELFWALCPASASMMTERESDALKLWNRAKEAK